MKKNATWQNQALLALIWLLIAILIAMAFSFWFDLNLPLFTLIFLIVPLVVLWVRKDARAIGMGALPWKDTLKWAGINLAALIVIYVVFEPWSGAYAFLLEEATRAGTGDPTFTWLTRFDGLAGWIGMFLFSGLITIFAEELFFRGWLQNTLRPKVGKLWANVIQAALFTLPQLIVAFLMPSPVIGVVYGLVYSFGAIGMINGWIATQASAIWPNLIAATVINLILSIVVLH